MLRLTNSEMKQFRRCRRQWWLGSYRGLRLAQTRIAGSPLTIGNRVHDALAAYYDPADQRDPLDVLRASCDADLAGLGELDEGAAKAIQSEWELTSAMLRGYLDWLEETGADSDLRVLTSEKKLEVPLIDGEATLLSKIDARVERVSTGARLALEHKTVGNLSYALPLLQLDTQLLTEHLAELIHLRELGDEDAEGRAEGVLYNMLRKVKRTASAKPPFYGRETVMHNVHELRNHWRHVVGTAREILRTRERLAAGENPQHVVPPNPTRDCTWDCPFFRVCPLFDDGSDAEGAVNSLYEVGDPLERYAHLDGSMLG